MELIAACLSRDRNAVAPSFRYESGKPCETRPPGLVLTVGLSVRGPSCVGVTELVLGRDRCCCWPSGDGGTQLVFGGGGCCWKTITCAFAVRRASVYIRLIRAASSSLFRHASRLTSSVFIGVIDTQFHASNETFSTLAYKLLARGCFRSPRQLAGGWFKALFHEERQLQGPAKPRL